MIHGHNGTDWKYSNIKHSWSCNINIAPGISRNTKKPISGPLSVDLWTMYIFSSFNTKIIFRPVSCLKYLQYCTNVVGKFTELSKIGFSMECFTAECWIECYIFTEKRRVAGWILVIKSKHFRDFLKISSF